MFRVIVEMGIAEEERNGDRYFFFTRLQIKISFLFVSLRDSSVGIALGYGLEDRGSRVRLPAGDGNFSLHHRVQDGSGAHPASYPNGYTGLLPWG
jgi:hypothetical protein